MFLISALRGMFGRVLAHARDFPRVRNDPTLLMAADVAVHVRWRGEQSTSISLERPKPIALIRKMGPEVIAALDELLETCTEREAALRLNELGYRNWKQQPFTVEMARLLGVSTTTVHN